MFFHRLSACRNNSWVICPRVTFLFHPDFEALPQCHNDETPKFIYTSKLGNMGSCQGTLHVELRSNQTLRCHQAEINRKVIWPVAGMFVETSFEIINAFKLFLLQPPEMTFILDTKFDPPKIVSNKTHLCQPLERIHLGQVRAESKISTDSRPFSTSYHSKWYFNQVS